MTTIANTRVEYEADLPATNPVPGVTRRLTYFNEILVITVELEPGAEVSPHTHTWGSVYYVLEGQGRAYVDGQWQEVGPGAIVEIPAGPEHGFGAITRSKIFEVQSACPAWFAEKLGAKVVAPAGA